MSANPAAICAYLNYLSCPHPDLHLLLPLADDHSFFIRIFDTNVSHYTTKREQLYMPTYSNNQSVTIEALSVES